MLRAFQKYSTLNANGGSSCPKSWYTLDDYVIYDTSAGNLTYTLGLIIDELSIVATVELNTGGTNTSGDCAT